MRKNKKNIMDNKGLIADDNVRKTGNMYFAIAKLVESADKYLEGEAALKALNFFTGMPVDDLLAKLAEKKSKNESSGINFGNHSINTFLSDLCVFGDHCQVTKKVLFQSYESYCRENGYQAYSRENFFREMYAAVPSLFVTRPRKNNPGREQYINGIQMVWS